MTDETTSADRWISEILFLAQHDANTTERAEIEKRMGTEFASGQNIYVSNFLDFSGGLLILLGEKGRVQWLSLVGEELDRVSSDIIHRRAWAQLLRSV